MEKNNGFKNEVILKICNADNKFNEFYNDRNNKNVGDVKIVELTSDNAIEEGIKSKQLLNLSYNSNFPDIDGMIGPFAIQFTISNSHTLAAEMVRILQHLYKEYKKTNDSITNESPFGLFFISPQDVVGITDVKNRSIKSYPPYFRKFIPKALEDSVKNSLILQARVIARTIIIKFEDLLCFL